MTAGAGAGALTARAGAGAWDRAAAGRRGAGSVPRGGRRAGRGAVTVTSGSVSDTWPPAGPGEISSAENVNAPKATAPNSRGFKTCSREGPRLVPNAPSIVAPKQHQISPSQVQPINDFLPPELPARRARASRARPPKSAERFRALLSSSAFEAPLWGGAIGAHMLGVSRHCERRGRQLKDALPPSNDQYRGRDHNPGNQRG